MLTFVCDIRIPFLRETLESAGINAVCLPATEITRETVKNADALVVRTRTHCGETLLDGSRVKFVATATIGFDHLDTAFLNARRIAWSNAAGCNAKSVAQYVVSVLAGRGLLENAEALTLGIVGAGHVGSEVEKLARSFGFRVLLNDPPRAAREGKMKFTELGELLRRSDVVTVHVPLEDGTADLLNADFVAAMKPNALLINTSRGEVADEEALLAAPNPLALDVWRREPYISRQLLRKAAVATGHIAGYSIDGKANATRQCVQKAAEFFELPELARATLPPLPPPPRGAEIHLPPENQLAAAVLHSYSAMADSAKLKARPEAFEELRNHYQVRREFGAFTVLGAAGENEQKLAEAGFKIG